MGYRIEYDRENGRYEISHMRTWQFPLMLAGVLGVFLLLVMHFWPEGAAVFRSALIPGDDAVTLQAFRNMTADLRSGATVPDALETFCRFVIHGK